MTDRELRRLSRLDLLELLLTQQKENERLHSLLEQAESRLAGQTIQTDNAEPFTEVSFQHSPEFYQQCLDSIRQLTEQHEMMCQKLVEDTKERCDRMVAEAGIKAQESWEKYFVRIFQLMEISARRSQKTEEASCDSGSGLHMDK